MSVHASGAGSGDGQEDRPEPGVLCDYCGVAALSWRKCKLICANCQNINKSCADL
jgi:hypothetical protein